MGTAIWWIRRDIRLQDNQALSYALDHFSHVIPVYILDPDLISKPYNRRDFFLFSALRSIDKDLRTKGNQLLVKKGKSLPVLQALYSELNCEMIVAERGLSPYARDRDTLISGHLPIAFVNGLTTHPPESILKSDGSPYTVYTPFSKVWKSLPHPVKPIPSPDFIPGLNKDIVSIPIPETSVNSEFPANENSANSRLSEFLSERVFSYKDQRNFLVRNGTSKLSPYFKFGLLSINKAVYKSYEIIDAVENAIDKENCITWLNELIWREFYFSILFQFPSVVKQSFRKNLRNIHWLEDQPALRAWQDGLTGYPVVDAGMRQLNATGWMHNRARMITASFLVKDLLINWQEGEKWFMENLIDGDLASNNGGWQWTAGTGTDAAPYFRIFNPILQSKKFDPDGTYIRKWVPEIAHLDTPIIHTPWQFENTALDYPQPIIDHRIARERTLAAYKAAKMLN